MSETVFHPNGSPKRVLVTGGLGVIGSSFAREMIARGHEVTVLDAAEEPRNLWLADTLPEAFIVRGRMEEADLLPMVEVADFVLHAAASTGIPHSAEDPMDDWRSNVDATVRLLEALRSLAGRGRRDPPTVCLSSVKPYSTVASPPAGVNESQLLDPDEPYAASKMAMSGAVMAWARSFNLPVTVLRMSNLYGAAPCHGPRHGWLTWFCISAAIGRQIQVQGDGNQSRDMLHSKDVTQAVLAAWSHIADCQGRAFNVGGGTPNVVSVRQAAQLIMDLDPSARAGGGYPGRRHEDRAFVTDHSLFTSVTGWEPKVSVEGGIRQVLDWAQFNQDALKKLYEGLV